MYKVYVIEQRERGSIVLTQTRTHTGSFAVAESAFWELHGREYSAKHLLLMTRDNKQINAYRYGSSPGDRDYIERGAPLNK